MSTAPTGVDGSGVRPGHPSTTLSCVPRAEQVDLCAPKLSSMTKHTCVLCLCTFALLCRHRASQEPGSQDPDTLSVDGFIAQLTSSVFDESSVDNWIDQLLGSHTPLFIQTLGHNAEVPVTGLAGLPIQRLPQARTEPCMGDTLQGAAGIVECERNVFCDACTCPRSVCIHATQDTEVPLPKTLVKRFTCEVCDRTYVHRESLRRHMRKGHRGACDTGETGRGAFECDICVKRWVFKSDMVRHRTSAHPESVGRGITHPGIHAFEKRYVCHFCDLSYAQRSKRNEHARNKHRHEVDAKRAAEDVAKMFACNYCGKKYLCGTSMYKHFARSHPEKKREARTRTQRELWHKVLNPVGASVVETADPRCSEHKSTPSQVSDAQSSDEQIADDAETHNQVQDSRDHDRVLCECCGLLFSPSETSSEHVCGNAQNRENKVYTNGVAAVSYAAP